MRALISFSSTSLLAAATLALVACSGSNDASVFQKGAPEAAPPPSENNGDAGDLFDGPSLVQEAAPAAVCAPQSASGFHPAWTPPEPWKQSVCSAQQISDFYDACLTPPISAATCQAFVQASASCAGCLQSQDSAAQAGAIVWHQSDAYWTVNIAGCIARATGDASGSGCGAAYAAAIACRQQSCSPCWAAQGSSATFEEFATCESQAGTSTCSTFAQAVPVACGNLTTGPASVCFPTSTATAQDAFMQIAPLFCGP